MCISCLFKLYKPSLVHIFYNNTVAKNVTPFSLEHIYSTPFTQKTFSSYTAVNTNTYSYFIPTYSTVSTTTIFNKVIKKVELINYNYPLKHIQLLSIEIRVNI